MSFVHLHVHTHYSLLDGLTKIDELIETAKADGAPAVAITDHGVMYGVIEFYQKCRKAGIKPIVGAELYLAPGSRFDKVTREHEKYNYHLLLLCKNETGYRNLIKLVSQGHLEGFYYKPRIDWELLGAHHEGLIALSACLGGEIPTLIRTGNLDKARRRIGEYRALFGEGNYYLELMDHPHLDGQDEVNRQLIAFGRELKVPLVATNDIHYLKASDQEAQDILLCLQNKKKLDDSDRMNMTADDYCYRSGKDMAAAFAAVPEAIENSVKIADLCDLNIELGSIRLPHFEVPSGYDGLSYLRLLCEDGLTKRYGQRIDQVSAAIRERMDYELSVIAKMGWPSYFLIVADFVNWAKDNGIVVGPGRGSAAGSIVCYLTGITNLDPLKYDLLFERFLNPDRISMPDIDMDFADTRRDEVLKYVEDKYGKDHVAQIITFGTMAARAAVRDVGRVLGYPYEFCDRLAKMIPMFANFDKALDTVPELKAAYQNEDGAKRVIDHARRLEGVARHASTHACGVLITKDQLVADVPLQYASTGDPDTKTIVSQYSLHPVEDLGLLKIDFLGLKNLTIIQSAIRIIRNTRGITVDIDTIPLDDASAYSLFQDGETTGVFQFESSGMKRYLKELKPTEFEDIIAMVALYRPGPMEWIPDYISGKHGRKKPQYLHPKLEPILKKTYGVAIYQEQVMQMARDLAGFTMAEADVLRKAVGKKIVKLLNEQKEKFVAGCVKNGIPSQLGETIFSFIEPFAGYGFNRSHAACYAMIAYQTAYLKSHWPVEFMAALLTADQGDTDRIAIEIEESRRMGLTVSSPDINQSFESFTVVTSGTAANRTVSADENVDTIRFGLSAIKNIGDHIAKELIEERKARGPYRDLPDLLSRVTDRDLNKKSLESLIKSGAFDAFGERGLLLGNIDVMINFNREVSRDLKQGQSSLFGDNPALDAPRQLKLAPKDAVDRQTRLGWERELMGLYISEHPFADYRRHLEGQTVPVRELVHHRNEPVVTFAGIITKVQKILTRTNKSMLFVKIEDDTAVTEALVFPKLLETSASVWTEGAAVLAQGRVSDKDQELKVLLNTATRIDLTTVEDAVNKLRLSGAASPAYRPAGDLKLVFRQPPTSTQVEQLKSVFTRYNGSDRVIMEVRANGSPTVIETGFRVSNSPVLQTELRKRFGEGVVITSTGS